MGNKTGNSPDPKSDKIDNTEGSKEDAATAAAREELMQTAISEQESRTKPESATDVGSAANDDKNKSEEADSPAGRIVTPTYDDKVDTRQQVPSPKKKRGHDQVDEDKEAEDSDGRSESSSDSARNRAERSQPEKKRPRDDVPPQLTDDTTASLDGGKTSLGPKNKEGQASSSSRHQTSVTSFASSGFARLTSSASPFGTLGATTNPSIFGGGATVAPPLSPPLPSNNTSVSTAPNPLIFGGTTNSFGGFGVLGAKPLVSFAQTGNSDKNGKPPKPFGAPDSDSEDDVNDGESREATPTEDNPDTVTEDAKKEDEKKKPRLQKMAVDDGETGEVTVLQVRAKLFHADKSDASWKERGVGMIKINVPESCVQIDPKGNPIPGSFDASRPTSNNEFSTSSRLLMRQDQTHRIVLNVAILPVMVFKTKATLKNVNITFTALESDQLKSFNVRMSAANAKLFVAEVTAVQDGLKTH